MNDYLEIYDSLSFDERAKLRDKITCRSCTNCTNLECRVEYEEKIGLDEFGQPQGNKCLAWTNKKMIVREKVKTLTKTR